MYVTYMLRPFLEQSSVAAAGCATCIIVLRYDAAELCVAHMLRLLDGEGGRST